MKTSLRLLVLFGLVLSTQVLSAQQKPLSVNSNADTLLITLLQKNVSCSGLESLSTSVLAGKAPFTYLWSTGETTKGIENLAPGIS